MQQTATGKTATHRAQTHIRLIAVVLLVAAGVATATRVPTWLRIRELKSADPKVRRAAVRELGGREGYTAIPAIRALIIVDPDPNVRAAAAYAAMKLDDALAAEPIRRAIRERPDHETTADMLATFARLCPPTPDAIAFVDACARSGKPYQLAGAAMARAEWFQPKGIDDLLTIAQSGPAEVTEFARDRLRQYLIPAAEMLGTQFDTGDPWPADRIDAMRSWWRRNGTPRLLEDALWPRRSRDDDLHEIERLQHARQRVGKMLGLL